jgi:hypothetical protein
MGGGGGDVFTSQTLYVLLSVFWKKLLACLRDFGISQNTRPFLHTRNDF